MIRKLQILLAVMTLLAAGLACNLPKSSTSATATPAAQAVSETPQDKASSTVDFSQVILQQSDLPQGFTPISQSELAQYGINLDTLLNSVSTPLAKAKPENLTIFSKVDGLNSTFIVSFILQPLTLIERGAFDLLAKDPQRAAQIFQNAIPDMTFTPQTGMETIGDSMLDVTFSYSKATLPLTGDLVISKRKQVVSVVVGASLFGAAPAVSAYDVAQIMDGKIVTALQK